MARGYLGKISAIVSANTGNYVRGLDESARRTAAFAKTIQSDLRNASRDASKSIDGILTPLQRVERALQNARSQRLSFRGFEGAIRTVEDLRKRIGTLELGDRELAVRVSGLRSVDALNKAIEGLKQEDIDLAVRVGGVDGIRRLRQEVKEVDGQVINVKTGRSAENLDFLISKFQALSAQRIQQVQIAVETAQFDRAEAAFKRTVSVAQGIAAPLGAAVQQLTTLSAGVQTAFGPALQIAQRAVDNLGKTIEANGRISDNTFERTAQRVERTAQAINRLAEASRIASSAATGVELGFVAPRVRSELTASAAARNAAAESADPSRFAARVQRLSQVDDLVIARQAEVESIRATGGDTSRPQKQLDDLLETSRRLRASIEQELKVDVDAATAQANLDTLKKTADQLAQALNREIALTIDGPQDIEQLQAAARSLVGELGRLDAAQQSIARPRLEALSAAIATGDIDQIRTAFERAKAVIERGIAVTVDTKAAKDRIAELDRRLNARLADGLGPSVTNQQVDAEFNKLTTSLDSLSTQNQLNLDPTIQELRDAIKAGENLERQLDRIVAAQERVALAAKIEALPEGSKVRQRAQEFFDRESTAPPSGPSPLGPAVDDAKKRIDAFGLPVDDSVRRLGVLQGALNSVKGQVDQLPIPLQARFVPLLAKAEAELQRLVGSGAATADQIKNAADEVARLKSQVDATAKASSAFAGTFSEFAESASIQSAQGRLQALRQLLVGAAGDTDRAVEAADDLAAAFNRAASTPGGFKEFSAQLDQVEAEAIQAAAAVLNITPKQLADQLKRAGDISRNGLGNVQLAVQQAAFAFDDFFSVTGDLSQRIRAAGNNISQLGFILGGVIPGLDATKGLIAGIAVSIGAQLVVQIIKWTNAGRTTEDQTKALNDALARQKSLVEELAQAFSSLGDSIARRAFSGPAQEARAFSKEIDDVIRKQKELRDQQAFALDEGVVQARADVNVAERQLGQATTRDQAVAAQRRLEEARTRLARQEALVRNRPALTPADTLGSIEEIFNQAARRAATTAAGLAGGAGGGVGGAIAADVARRQVDERRVELQRRVAAAGDPTAAIRILRAEQAASAQRGDDRLVAQLEELINRLRTEAASQAADAFAVSLIRTANRAAVEIEQAQNRVAEAIDAGVPGALRIRTTLDRLGEVIDDATSEIADAQADFATSAQSDADAALRDGRVRAAQQRIERSRDARNETLTRAREIDFSRTVDPQSLLPAVLDRARANLDAAQAPAGILARQQRELEARRRQLLQDADSQNPFVRRRAERGLEELDAQARAIEAATLALRTFSDSLNRASQVVQSDLDSARQEADAARRRDIAFSTPETRRERQRTEQNFRDQQDAANRAQAEIERARIRQEQEVTQGQAQLADRDRLQARADQGRQLEDSLREIFGKQRDFAGQATGNRFANEDEVRDELTRRFGAGSPEVQEFESLVEESKLAFRRLLAAGFGGFDGSVDQALRDLEAAQAAIAGSFAAQFAELRNIEQQLQAGTDIDNVERERLVSRREELQRELQPEIDRRREEDQARIEAAERLREVAGLQARGRELISQLTPRGAAESLATDLEAVRQAFGQQAEAANGLIDQAGLRDTQGRVIDQAIRQQAPLVAQFSDEVANAILQGPSRAALQASDASTVEGQRELNRLLRGEDPARDVSLLELQKQTAAVEELVRIAREGPQVAE